MHNISMLPVEVPLVTHTRLTSCRQTAAGMSLLGGSGGGAGAVAPETGGRRGPGAVRRRMPRGCGHVLI